MLFPTAGGGVAKNSRRSQCVRSKKYEPLPGETRPPLPLNTKKPQSRGPAPLPEEKVRAMLY